MAHLAAAQHFGRPHDANRTGCQSAGGECGKHAPRCQTVAAAVASAVCEAGDVENAVIRLTPDSEEHSQVDAPIAPAGSGTDAADAARKFDIDNLRVVDSLLIWQRADNEQINVRDINLTLQQTEKRRAQLELSSRVNRDQRDLIFSMAADVDLQQFPRQIGAKVTQFNYQLAGADILNGGIQGEGNAQVVYQQTPAQIAVSQLNVSANNSQLTGNISATLGQCPAMW